MIYSRIKAGVWVKYEDDAEIGTILFRRKLVDRRREINERLAELPIYPTNAELLEWARERYPFASTEREQGLLQAELEMIQTDLDSTAND